MCWNESCLLVLVSCSLVIPKEERLHDEHLEREKFGGILLSYLGGEFSITVQKKKKINPFGPLLCLSRIVDMDFKLNTIRKITKTEEAH